MTARTIDRAERSNAEGAVIRQMLAMFDPFLTLRGTVTARGVQAFLLVAAKEGLSVTEYAKKAGISLTTMSRILLDMGERDRNFEEGLGLVEGRENALNRREKIYSLTPKGRALLASIMKAKPHEAPPPLSRDHAGRIHAR